MLTPLLVAYFVSKLPTVYHVEVSFNGYLPVLGGKEGNADVLMDVLVTGLEEDAPGICRSSSEVQKVTMKLNGANLPLGLSAISAFFPKTITRFSKEGKVLGSDLRSVELPVKLPGLDPKRFADITYLPVEFPVGGIQEGKTFGFSKSFGGDDLNYKVTPIAISKEQINLAIEVSQETITYEDANANSVTDRSTAAYTVSTTVHGKGIATFLIGRGAMKSVSMKVDAEGAVTPVTAGVTRKRHLTTELKISANGS